MRSEQHHVSRCSRNGMRCSGKNRTLLLAFVCYFTLGLNSECLSQEAEDFISFEASSLTTEIVSFVAASGKTTTLLLPQGTDLLALISNRCGTMNAKNAYISIFANYNRGIHQLSEGNFRLENDESVEFPACAFADEVIVESPVSASGPVWSVCITSPLKSVCSPPSPETIGALGVDKRLGVSYLEALNLPLPIGGKNKPLDMSVDRLRDPILAEAYKSATATPLESSVLGGSNSQLSVAIDKAIEHAVMAQQNAIENAAVSSAAVSSAAANLQAVVAAQDIRLANEKFRSITALPEAAVIARPAPTAGVRVRFELSEQASPLAAVAAVDALMEVSPDLILPESILATRVQEAPVPAYNELCGPEDAIDTKRWPFDIAELEKAISLARSAAKLQNTILNKRGTVLVFDTGFPPDAMTNEPFTAEYFVVNSVAKDLLALNPFAEIPKQMQRSFDLAAAPDQLSEYTVYHSNKLESSHGVQVATIAAGGLAFLRSPFAQDLTPKSGAIIVANGYSATADGTLSVDDRAYGRVVNSNFVGYNIAPSIVNLSLLSSVELTASITKASWGEGILYVVAAGNSTEGSDISLKRWSPAYFGGARSPNIITVGSLKTPNEYAQYAHYSPFYVDIAAPGCYVPTLSWNEEKRQLVEGKQNGTSMAAPITSFAASLIFNAFSNERQVKARIVGTADYNVTLRSKVWSSGSLNIPKAFSSMFDLIELTDGTYLYGRLETQAQGWRICGQKVDRSRAIKITRVDATHWRFSQVHPGSGQVDFVDCEGPSTTDFAFREVVLGSSGSLSSSSPIIIGANSIRDLTFCSSEHCFDLGLITP